MFNKLKDVLKLLRIRRELEKWHDQPGWNNQDVAAWNAFLVTHTGQKLNLTIRNGISVEAAQAVGEHSHMVWQCGYASGFRGLALLLEYLRQLRKENAPSDKDSAENREYLNP